MIRTASYIAATFLCAAGTARAQLPVDTAHALADVTRAIEEQGPVTGPATWPGFRPDTIPVAFVLPERGVLLVHWRGPLPSGFSPSSEVADAGWRPVADRGAASTGVDLGGRGAAQVVVHTLARDTLAGLMAHEAFHVFQRAERRDGQRFGDGENSVLVSRYPVFDVQNEAAVALEGRLLSEALSSGSPDATRRLVHEWLAVRESRQRRLGAELTEFEQMAEMNEGLAEYVFLRMQAAVRGRPAGEAPATLMHGLDSLEAQPGRSVRLRAYRTGPAQAYLLDRLAGSGWKDHLRHENLTLQDALAEASGYRASEATLVADAEARHRGLSAEAERSVAVLRRLRAAQVDSIRGALGLLLRISAARMGRSIGLCGIDPQNLLRASETVALHTRWVRLCSGPPLAAELMTASVHDAAAGTVEVPVGEATSVRVTIDGRSVMLADGERATGAVKIESPAITLTSARAELTRQGRILVLSPLSPDS